MIEVSLHRNIRLHIVGGIVLVLIVLLAGAWLRCESDLIRSSQANTSLGLKLAEALNERDHFRREVQRLEADEQAGIDAFKAALKEANDRAAMWLAKLNEEKAKHK